ncbi:MAG: hypothetical protein OEZ43_16805 [Gammaproteobacteria bacterium]|nr:hypothetical protein [Gammaproteobacteria bacterium]
MNKILGNKVDISFRHMRMGRLMWSIEVVDLFDSEGKAAVDIVHGQAISWQGRRLPVSAQRVLIEALGQIQVQTMPRKAEHLGEGQFILIIDIAGMHASYEWSGRLPTAWFSLQPIVKALQEQVVHRE